MAYRRICNRDCADALDNSVVKWGKNCLESEPRADPNTKKTNETLIYRFVPFIVFLFSFLNFCIYIGRIETYDSMVSIGHLIYAMRHR